MLHRDPDPEWYHQHLQAFAARPDDAVMRWQQWWTRLRPHPPLRPAGERAAHGPAGETAEFLARRCAATQGFVLTRAQTRACGVTSPHLRRLLYRRAWSTPARGVYATLHLVDEGDGPFAAARRSHALTVAAVLLNRPGQVASGSSAAVLHGLPLARDPLEPELTAAPPTTPGNRSRALIRPATLTTAEVETWYGVALTTVARTLVDLARHDRRDAIVAADAALRASLTTPSLIAAALARQAGWPGVRRARATLALASPLSESPLESLTRLALWDGGVPPPQLQVTIHDPISGRVYRVDMLWPEHRLVLEVDGRLKYQCAELWDEKRRQEHLERLGYRVLRVLSSDLGAEWPATLRRIRAALASPVPASPLI